MRTLVEQGRWIPNSSVLKADAQGLYLQWPQAAGDLIDFGRARGYPAWPSDAATLQALLQAAGLVQHAGRELGLLSLVDAEGEGEIILVLQIAQPIAVLEDFDTRDWSRAGAGAWRRLAPAAPRSQPPASIKRAPTEEAASGPRVGDLFADLAPPQGEVAALSPIIQGEPGPAHTLRPETTAPTLVMGVETQDEADAPHPTPPPPLHIVAPTPDVVPPDLAALIGTPAQVEHLRRVVSTWRARSPDSAVMRRIEDGAAIEFAFLTTLVPDVPTWVDCMARAGLVHVPPKTPGLRIQKVVLVDGRPPVQAVVLSPLACRRLGL